MKSVRLLLNKTFSKMKKISGLVILILYLSSSSLAETYTTAIYTTDSLYIYKYYKTFLPQNGYKNFYFQLLGPYTTLPNVDLRVYTVWRYNYVSKTFQSNYHNSALNSNYQLWTYPPVISFGYVIDFEFAKTDTSQFICSRQAAWWEPMMYVYYSIDNGLSGSEVFSSSLPITNYSMAIDPVDKNIMYIGQTNTLTRINKTTNRGANWVAVDSISNNFYAPVMKVNPFNHNTVFLTTNSGLKRSLNAGYNFQDVSIIPVDIRRFVFNNNDSSIFVTTHTNNAGILKSTNNGTSWSVIFNLKCYDMEIDPLNENIFYAGTDNGIYKSTNKGANWFIYNNTFTPSKTVLGLVKNPNSGDTIFTVTSKAVYKVYGQAVSYIQNINELTPSSYILHQNYPNPFNPSTTIKFDLPKTSDAKLIIYDALGREVATLVNEKLSAGSYEVSWDGSSYTSGVYYYRLITESFVDTKKLVLLK
ncbi:MAG: T9SS type A sorting domain-containing protein [Ignavibacteria bacterium]|nr:T9SS type A sorting domain-containing protein [Ignavibacteria bacterium]